MGDNFAELRQQIDRDISLLEQRIMTLRTHRNRIAPIAGLAIETMARIFGFACIGNTKIPLTLSSVSRDWRELVLDLPELWSRIDARLQFQHIPAYMARSRQRPLRVALKNLNPMYNDTILAVLQELPRIQEMEIGEERSQQLDMFSWNDADEWKIEAPVLRRLVLERVSIPMPIFSGHIPVLYELALDDCRFDWNLLPPLPRLTSLIITRPHNRITLGDFLKRLRFMSSLERLRTNRTLMELGNLDHSLQFQLPNVTYMRLERENCSLVAQMLQSLVTPRINELIVSLRQDSAQDQLTLRNALDHCTPVATSPVRLLSVKARRNCCGYVIHCDSISVYIRLHYTPSSMGDIYAMCNHLKLEKLEDLRVDFMEVTSMVGNTHFWERFAGLVGLREFTVRNDAVKDLVGYLNYEHDQIQEYLTYPDDSDDDSSRDILKEMTSYRTVKELLVQCLHQPVEIQTSHLNSIAQYLRIRKEYDEEIPSLVVATEHPPPNALMDALQRSVGQFRIVAHEVKSEFNHCH
ncbi:hypothetical protein BDN72DRAFT_843558 [Pluteus cervinus]|uniref:Uncharacterized protein n=1 Tax=Pluteus cervinus TaxID=181527 RepID=A0ACD3AMQ0_9AGAR|nr:hypothetical protein BDN72DRAFT_843558 [Pluteus cervinus]